MRRKPVWMALLGAAAMVSVPAVVQAQTMFQPRTMPGMADVDPRFVSFNVETVEITGGRFWKPYGHKGAGSSAPPAPAREQNQPPGMDASMFQYRPPIDLKDAKLRKLAAGLAPSFLRVSGTWRNSTFYQDTDGPAPASPPAGYKGVMTRAQWKGVIDFAHSIKADLVTSVATSAGARDGQGNWTPGEAKGFFDDTKRMGASIAATEFMNEPTFATMGGAPANYDARAFARDVKNFRAFLKKESPQTLLLGPGSVGEGASMVEGSALPVTIRTEDMLKATGPVFDAFSYHFYGGVSQRCSGLGGTKSGSPQEWALSTAWLDKNITVEEFYARLRDEFLAGKPMWLTETGEAACGGDPWASSFLDSFRYMDQLGALAQRNVKTVMVNTLASSDYGLLDENTHNPRPNYWAALLWKRTMGTRVLNPGATKAPGMRVYAQCMLGNPGGVTMLVLNLGKTPQTIQIPLEGRRYVLSSAGLLSRTVLLNGKELSTGADGTLPAISGETIRPGTQHLAPLTITFLTLPGAQNPNCR